jgi:hypothetical protein
MPKFTADNQPEGRGRKQGSKNKKSLIDELTQQAAKDKLSEAVQNGEPWAIQAVLDRVQPKLKPCTPLGTLDAELLEAKIFEISELEQRLAELEKIADESGK